MLKKFLHRLVYVLFSADRYLQGYYLVVTVACANLKFKCVFANLFCYIDSKNEADLAIYYLILMQIQLRKVIENH